MSETGKISAPANPHCSPGSAQAPLLAEWPAASACAGPGPPWGPCTRADLARPSPAPARRLGPRGLDAPGEGEAGEVAAHSALLREELSRRGPHVSACPQEVPHPPAPGHTGSPPGSHSGQGVTADTAASDQVQLCASRRAQTLYILRAAACIILRCHFM